MQNEKTNHDGDTNSGSKIFNVRLRHGTKGAPYDKIKTYCYRASVASVLSGGKRVSEAQFISELVSGVRLPRKPTPSEEAEYIRITQQHRAERRR